MPCVILGKWSQEQGEEGQARKKTLILEGGEPGACPNSALGRLGNLGHVSILRPWSLLPVDWAGCHLRPLLLSIDSALWARKEYWAMKHMRENPKPSAILERYFGDTYVLLSLGHVYGFVQTSASLFFLLVMTNRTAIPTPHHVPTFWKERKPTWHMYKCFRPLSHW